MRAGEAAFDGWSIVHIASGYALNSLTAGQALAVLTGFEVVESILRNSPRADGRGLTEYESAANIVADIGLGMLGWYVGRK